MDLKNDNALIRKYVSIGFVLIILLAAFLVRIHDLDGESLENDELDSWVTSSSSGPEEVLDRTINNDVHPPAYYLILNQWIQYFGDSESALRFPSVIFGTIAVWLLYLLGSQIYSRSEALAAAALMAVLIMPTFHSQSARSYALLLCLVTQFTYLLVLMIKDQKSPAAIRALLFIGYALTGAALLYTHYFGAFVVASHFVYLAMYQILRRKHLILILAFALMFILFLPWIPYMLQQMQGNQVGHVQTPGPLIFFYLSLHIFNFSVLIIALSIIVLLSLIYRNRDSLGIANLLAKTREFFSRSNNGLLIILILGPILFSLITSILLKPNAVVRNFIVILPAIYLFAARGITLLFERFRRPQIVALTILFIGIFSLVIEKDYYGRVYKEQFRDAVEYLATIDPGGVLPVAGLALDKRYLGYYFTRMNMPDKPDVIAGYNEDIQKFDDFVDGNGIDRLWYIYAHRIPETEFMEHLKSRFDITREEHYFRTGVYLLERRQQ